METVMEKKKIGTNQTLRVSEVISYLEDLLTAFKAGQINISKGAETLSLCPQGEISLEIEAKQKKDYERFSFELSWENAPALEAAALPFSISGSAPGEKAKEAQCAVSAETGKPVHKDSKSLLPAACEAKK
jgi:amphi-Trp domain-containing protein